MACRSFAATLIAGVLLVLCSIFHIGRLTSFIPAPCYYKGFTSGITRGVRWGRIDNFWSLHRKGSSAVQKLFSYGRLGFPVEFAGCFAGNVFVLFMVFFRKSGTRWCRLPFWSIIIATVISVVMKLDVKQWGAIPKTAFSWRTVCILQRWILGYQGLSARRGEYCHAGDD